MDLTYTTKSGKVRKDFRLAGEKLQPIEVKGCVLKVLPIYPVRYGLSINYLKDIQEKGLVSEIDKPTGMFGAYAKGAHQIMQLRQGFIYIYTKTPHRLNGKIVSSDEKGHWLVFRYITHRDDMNSNSEFEHPSGNFQETFSNHMFLLYKFGEEGANGKWEPIQLEQPCIQGQSSFNVAFVSREVAEFDIAYSEYAWSAELFEKLEQDKTLRHSIMTTIKSNIVEERDENGELFNVSKGDGIHSAPLREIAQQVTEYSNLYPNLAKQTENWHTRLDLQTPPQQTQGLLSYKRFGLVVALEDVVGEMRELQNAILNLTEKQQHYYAQYAYPITIGNIIDPKLNYDLRGQKYPFDAKQRVIEQKGVRSALIPEFQSKMTALLKEPIMRFEKPIDALADQIAKLADRGHLIKILCKCSQPLKINQFCLKGAPVDRHGISFSS